MFITSRMRTAHTAKVMFSEFLSFCSQEGGGGVWVSRKVYSEHIVATKVLMPGGVGGWRGVVGCPGKCTLSTLLLQKCSCPWGVGCGGVQESAKMLMPMGRGGVSGKVHSEHIVATLMGSGVGGIWESAKVLMPMGGVRESAL